jgi:hypothetical protein
MFRKDIPTPDQNVPLNITCKPDQNVPLNITCKIDLYCDF